MAKYKVEVKLELTDTNYYVTDDIFTIEAENNKQAILMAEYYLRAWDYVGKVTKVTKVTA